VLSRCIFICLLGIVSSYPFAGLSVYISSVIAVFLALLLLIYNIFLHLITHKETSEKAYKFSPFFMVSSHLLREEKLGLYIVQSFKFCDLFLFSLFPNLPPSFPF